MAEPMLRRNGGEEQQFQKWIRSTPWFSEFVKEYGEEPDLNTKDYDYRKAWREGLQPVRDKYDNNRYHWPSSSSDGTMLKSKDHPTAWKEEYMRRTGQNPDAVGAKKPDDAPKAEKWKPFEGYDKFRQPGFWRGDDPEIKRNPNAPAGRPPRQSLLEQIPLNLAMERVALEGRYGDTELAHITPEEKITLAMNGGANTINPDTGIAEFYPEENATMAEDEPAAVLAEKSMPSTSMDKSAVEELKAIRDMIREAKAAGKSEDKKTLKEITKRHKLLLDNLISGKAVKNDVKGIPLEAAVKRVAMEGRGGDTMVAHIMPEEAQLLKAMGGSGAINPKTGLREFDAMGTGSYGNDTGGNDFGGASNNSDSTTTTSNDLSQSQMDSYSDFGNAMDSLGGMGGTNLGGTNSGFSFDGSDWGFGQSWAPQEAGMYEGPSKASTTFDRTNNWGLGIGDASAFAGTGTGLFGGLNYAAQVGLDAASAGVRNSLDNMTFGDVAGFLGGMAVSSLVGPVAGGLLGGGLVGAIGGRVAGSYAGSQASNAISNAVNTGALTSSTNPNASAPATANTAGQYNTNYDTPSATAQGAAPLNYDQRIAPLTSAQVNPLAVQPTTTVADDATTSNPFSSGIYIPPIGAPTAGRPLRMNT